MNKQLIDIIKKDLIENMKCETCGSIYKSIDILIKSLGGNKSFITAKCKECNNDTQFKADITEEKSKISTTNVVNSDITNTDKTDAEMDKKYIFNYSGKKPEKKKSTSNGIIQNEEIVEINNKMKLFSSFKNLFSIALVFSIFFTGCASTAEENRQDILKFIEDTKEKAGDIKTQSEKLIEDGKSGYEKAKKIINDAPGEIEKIKKDVEGITGDVMNLKKNIEDKIETTKNAIDQTQKAVNSVGKALDSINNIGKSLNSSGAIK